MMVTMVMEEVRGRGNRGKGKVTGENCWEGEELGREMGFGMEMGLGEENGLGWKWVWGGRRA